MAGAKKKKKLRKPNQGKPARAKKEELSLERVEARLAAAEATLVPRTKAGLIVRSNELRQIAAIEYITDPEAHTVEWWWSREDRPYKRTVAFNTFRDWCTSDNWSSRRDKFWSEIEQRVLEEKQHQLLMQRLKEVDELTEVRGAMMEYMQPLRNPDGTIKRYEDGRLTGLPEFPLELPSMEKFVTSLINVDKLLMLKRGETINRSETITNEQERASVALGGGAKASFSRDEIQALSRYMLKMRQPELGDFEPIDIHDEVYGAQQDGAEDDDDGDG